MEGHFNQGIHIYLRAEAAFYRGFFVLRAPHMSTARNRGVGYKERRRTTSGSAELRAASVKSSSLYYLQHDLSDLRNALNFGDVKRPSLPCLNGWPCMDIAAFVSSVAPNLSATRYSRERPAVASSGSPFCHQGRCSTSANA